MKKNSLYIFLFLVLFYALTRIVNLNIIPIFTDEAIYAYWAQIALHDPANRFISLEDGKQPLFIWLAALLQKFVSDPLVATRMVSTVSGFFSLVGIYFLAKTLFTTRTALVSVLLYIVLPITLLYDRMALYDSLLTAIGIWAVFFLVKLAVKPQLDNALLAGITLGLAQITKSSGAFFMYLAPLSILASTLRGVKIKQGIVKWLGFVAFSVIISQVIYNALRLSPLFYVISRKNLEFIRSVPEALADPFGLFIPNASSLIKWIIGYISLPLFLILLFGIAWGLYKKNLKVIYLSILAIVPFLAESTFNKVIYPRFILFYIPYIIILVAFGFNIALTKFAKYSKFLYISFATFLIYPALNSYRLLTNPTLAAIATSDASQYLNDWPAGYGVAEIVQITKSESSQKEVYVGTEGTFGLLPFAMQIYFYGANNVHIIGFWPVDSNNLPGQIMDIAKVNKTYFVFNENQKEITSKNLKFAAKYQKGKGDSYMRLYEVLP